MLVGYVSDEAYAALPDVLIEFRGPAAAGVVVRSTPRGAVFADVPPGEYEVGLAHPGHGSRRLHVRLGLGLIHFRLLSNRLLGYAWPKWSRAGDAVQFRLHSVSPCRVELHRLGLEREVVRKVGWFDNHGPRALLQSLPCGHFVETGVGWDAGHGIHRQVIEAPARSGLYYFHTANESGEEFGFPLVVAPREPAADVAYLASTNTWNAYNAFGGRSNYIMAARMLDEPILNSKSDLPRYRLADYGEWKSAETFAPLSFDRPEPYNHIPRHERCTDPIPGRQASHLAAAEWRVLGWLEQQGLRPDVYADHQLHDGTLDLKRYRVLVLGPHPEYWSAEAYRRVKQWVYEQGGRLVYLGGNGINCCVEYLDGGTAMRCLNQWPDGCESRFHHAVESEARLLGVVYSDPGAMTAAPFEVLESRHWVFEGTGLRRGDTFGKATLHERYPGGASGHETDKRSPSSPAQAVLLARGLNRDDGGAHLTIYETASGGAVFAAGSITYPAALLCDPHVSRITANVMKRFLRK
jgi:hypothetical protein